MKLLKVVSIFIFLLVANVARAQSATLSWTQPQENPADTPQQALAKTQAYTYTYKIDSAATITLTPVTCSLTGTAVTCQATIVNPAPGQHTIVLTATNSFGSGASTISGAPPVPAVSIKIVINVTNP